MFSLGDKVQWTHTSRRGKTISMTRKEGEVVSVHNDSLTVKSGRKQYNIHVSFARKIGEKSELSEFVEAVVKANRREKEND